MGELYMDNKKRKRPNGTSNQNNQNNKSKNNGEKIENFSFVKQIIELDDNNIVKELIPVSVFNIDISPFRHQKFGEVSDKCNKAIVLVVM